MKLVLCRKKLSKSTWCKDDQVKKRKQGFLWLWRARKPPENHHTSRGSNNNLRKSNLGINYTYGTSYYLGSFLPFSISLASTFHKRVSNYTMYYNKNSFGLPEDFQNSIEIQIITECFESAISMTSRRNCFLSHISSCSLSSSFIDISSSKQAG